MRSKKHKKKIAYIKSSFWTVDSYKCSIFNITKVFLTILFGKRIYSPGIHALSNYYETVIRENTKKCSSIYWSGKEYRFKVMESFLSYREC